MAQTPDSTLVLATGAYPSCRESLPVGEIPGGSYRARFARDLDDLRAVQRLRFEVFNVELNEGLDCSWKTGLDEDEFDAGCHHLIVELKASREVVGTYRVQTLDMARGGQGLYTEGEFDLSEIPPDVLEQSVETGRACVAAEHRSGRVLTLLWKGLAAYLVWNRKRYLFGCCSLTSQDPHVAKQTYDFLRSGSFAHPTLRTRPTADYVCYPPSFEADPNVSVKLPPLFASYLKLGAHITGEPALDRAFKTIDFLALLDTHALDPATVRTFFGPGTPP
jgi:putative hemolysin